MKTTDLSPEDLEEAAAESEQDRRDHRNLLGNVELLLQHDNAMRVPIAVRRLYDAGVDPVVIAKTLAIGDRDGPFVYALSAKVHATALSEHERIAVDWVSIAIRDLEPDLGATMLVSGAVWLSTQFGLTRGVLASLVRGAAMRQRRGDRRGYGVVDLVDHHGVGDRESIAIAIELAQLPLFAPLTGSQFKVPS